MEHYLSFGCGVNSTALLLLLQDTNLEFETVFVNHGGDYPETYEYLTYLQDRGFKITEVTPEVKGKPTKLYDFCLSRSILPSRRYRWCTSQFKVSPFLDYVQTPCTVYLGFDSDEKKRAERREKKRKKEDDISYQYPLIDSDLNRDKCIDLIKCHGLEVPPKSGCFFCPFMKRSQIRDLYLNDRILYERVKLLELKCRKRNPNRFLRDRPIEINAGENLPPLTEYP